MRFTDGPKIPPRVVFTVMFIAFIFAHTVGYFKQQEENHAPIVPTCTPAPTETNP